MKKRPIKDEYNWEVYTKEYSQQAIEAANSGHQGSDAIVKRSYMSDGKLVYKDNLHGNWKGVYSAICELKPATVFECGCGGMHHLYNIQKLMPGVLVYGCDLLQTQIDWGADFHNIPPNVINNVSVMDFSNDFSGFSGLSRYDFVFSQAVIMHLSHDKALKFVKNMVKIANKYIYMVEGPQHDYVELMQMSGFLDSFNVSSPAYNALLFTRK